MLILNQEGDTIVNTDNVIRIGVTHYLKIEDDEIEWYYVEAEVPEDSIELGRYKSEKRAVEVLHKILMHYTCGTMCMPEE